MKGLIRCHLSYLFSKKTLIISFLALIFVIIAFLESIFNIDNKTSYLENNYQYFLNGFFQTKLITIFLSIFVFGFSFLDRQENYTVIIIASGTKRIKVFLSKIFTLCSFLFVFNYFSYFIYVLIGLYFYDFFEFNLQYLYGFFSLFLISIYFGFLSLLLIQLFKNIYTLIIPFGLYNISEILNDDINLITKILNLFIPYFSRNFVHFYGIIHLVILILFLGIINTKYYLQKDL